MLTLTLAMHGSKSSASSVLMWNTPPDGVWILKYLGSSASLLSIASCRFIEPPVTFLLLFCDVLKVNRPGWAALKWRFFQRLKAPVHIQRSPEWCSESHPLPFLRALALSNRIAIFGTVQKQHQVRKRPSAAFGKLMYVGFESWYNGMYGLSLLQQTLNQGFKACRVCRRTHSAKKINEKTAASLMCKGELWTEHHAY